MKRLLFLLLVCSSCIFLSAQPKTEVRAVWLTTNHALDWPSRPVLSAADAKAQKEELCRKLDQLKAANFNLVFLQTRIRGNLIYPSQIEPMNALIKRDASVAKEYDPLAFAIEECHKRGLECHAWFVTYPLGPAKVGKKPNPSLTIQKNKNITKTHNGEVYLDPGNPQTQSYLLSLVREIVSGYDIDGLHLDYVRYPEKADKFPDQATYKAYGKGKTLAEWRRENINRTVYGIYDCVKDLKPWVQVSSSVIGMYEHIPGNGFSHWTGFNSVYQDAADWLEKGKHDFIVPMMYYADHLFFPFVPNWKSHCGDRWVVPGLGVYRLEKREGDWAPEVILRQIDYSRSNRVAGNAFYRAQYLLEDQKQLMTEIQERYYTTPALLPPLSWIDSIPPAAPQVPEAIGSADEMVISWQSKDTKKVYYNIYRSESRPVDTTNPANLIATRLDASEFRIPISSERESGYFYLVTASDRYHNESAPSQEVFFCTGNFEK